MSETIKIRMFGEFSIQYNNSEIKLERNIAANASNILQFLLYNYGNEVSKSSLLNAVFFTDNTDNPSNNLKVNILRLRKLIASSPLPEGDYVLTKSKTYTFNTDIPLEIDCKLFENYIKRSQSEYVTPQQKTSLLLKAFEAYTGEFLPSLKHIPWVKEANSSYRLFYLQCINELYTLLKHTGEMEKLLSICSKASEIYPYDEDFQLLKLSCLVDMKKYPEANTAFENISKLIFENTGKALSEKMHSVRNTIQNNLDTHECSTEDIKSLLKNNSSSSCVSTDNLSAFLNFAYSISKKHKLSLYITLYTITDSDGKPLSSADNISKSSAILNNVLLHTLASSTVFSRYSQNQFVVIHAGTSHEECILSEKTVISAFEDFRLKNIRLKASSTSI